MIGAPGTKGKEGLGLPGLKLLGSMLRRDQRLGSQKQKIKKDWTLPFWDLR
jgi:hypothetical protein